jgi:hypothetical protein
MAIKGRRAHKAAHQIDEGTAEEEEEADGGAETVPKLRLKEVTAQVASTAPV